MERKMIPGRAYSAWHQHPNNDTLDVRHSRPIREDGTVHNSMTVTKTHQRKRRATSLVAAACVVLALGSCASSRKATTATSETATASKWQTDTTSTRTDSTSRTVKAAATFQVRETSTSTTDDSTAEVTVVHTAYDEAGRVSTVTTKRTTKGHATKTSEGFTGGDIASAMRDEAREYHATASTSSGEKQTSSRTKDKVVKTKGTTVGGWVRNVGLAVLAGVLVFVFWPAIGPLLAKFWWWLLGLFGKRRKTDEAARA